MSDLGDYLAPDDRERALLSLAERGGAEVRVYGESVQGRRLHVVRLPSAAGPRAPKVICIANIHGVEWIGSRVATGLLESLVHRVGLAGELRDAAEVWIAPCANPDGYARTFEQRGRGSLAELRTNAHGVDLNRNFPLPGGVEPSWIPSTGSSVHGAATYRGLRALSEPETLALDGLLASEGFHAALSLHSFMGTMIPARVTDRASYGVYRHLCRAFRRAQTDWGYLRLSSRLFDVFTGEFEDHAHHARGTWASCVEVFPVWHSIRQHIRAPSLFWRFNPRRAERYVANDVPGLAAFFLAALERPRPTIGTY